MAPSSQELVPPRNPGLFTPEEAGAKAQAWVLRILADRLDKGEAPVHNLHFELRLPATTAVAPENILTQAASA